jgi:hypothetical protein
MKSSNYNDSESDEIYSLKHLSEPVLTEVVREAETMIASQYKSHVASEQRGLAIFGFCLTTATALSGAYVAVDKTKINGELLSNVSLIQAVFLIFAGIFSGISIWPRKIDIPGNEPKNWAPKHWPSGVRRDMKQTRLEQCKVLQKQISENRKVGRLKAQLQRTSIIIAFISVIFCVGYIVYKIEFTNSPPQSAQPAQQPSPHPAHWGGHCLSASGFCP